MTTLTLTEKRIAQRVLWPLVVPLLLLTLWLGARGLNMDALWYDEWLSVYYAGGAHYGPIAPAEIWARVAERSTWPPGFQTLLAGWGALVGWDQVVTRTLPLLFGLLAVAWAYRMGKTLASPLVGLGAAVAIGASAFFANYLHELRGYTLYALFSAMCAWAYWQITYRRGGRWAQIGLFASVVGLLYTHYFATLTAVAVAVYHGLVMLRLLPARLRPPVRGVEVWRVPIIMALAGLTFLPWANIAFQTARDAFENEGRRIVPLDGAQVIETLLYAFSNASIALLALLAIYALFSRRRAVLFAWGWALFVLGLLVVVNERLQVIFHIRHLMALWPALALIVGLGVERLREAGVRPALVLLIWLAAGVWNTLTPSFIESQPGEERAIAWETLAPVLATLDAQAQPSDAVALHIEQPGREWLSEPLVDYYFHDLPARARQMEQIRGLPENDDYLFRVRRWVAGAPRLWTVVMPDVPSTFHVREFWRYLDSKYAHCSRPVDRPEIQLDLWARTPSDDEWTPTGFGDDIAVRVLKTIEPIGERLHILLGWFVRPEVPPDTYSVALHLSNADDRLVAQADYPLPTGPYACRLSEIELAAVPAGDYTLHAVVYNWQTGDRRPAHDADGETGDRLLLWRVRLP